MPARGPYAIVSLLLLLACSPSEFAWQATLPADLANYRTAFAAAAGTKFEATSTRATLLAQLPNRRVLWLGDHHASSMLHGLHLELLEAVAAVCADSRRPLVLVLDALGEQDQPAVTEFLGGRLEMRDLQRQLRARWPGSWLDDSALDPWYYRSLLAFGKRHGTAVHALEPTPRLPLADRDPRMAARIAAIATAAPDALVVVVVGQAHLLGTGDMVRRTGLPGLALGGEPPAALLAAATEPRERGVLQRSDGGLWWFAELLRGER
jgi:uncharacterized iron-regulated protein